MSKRKANKPWLALGEPGTQQVNPYVKIAMRKMKVPNRRRAKALKRRVNVITMILEGKMK